MLRYLLQHFTKSPFFRRFKDAYKKQEIEKSKLKAKKSLLKLDVPTIRYHSIKMALLDNDDDDEKGSKAATPKFQSRNFISFSDEQTFNEFFKKPLQNQSNRKRPVSRK